MRSVSLIVLALSACTSGRSVPPHATPPTAQASAPTSGQVVTEIDPRIWCIHQDRDGTHWFGSNGSGVYRYDGQRVTNFTRDDGLGGNRVRDIEEDSEGGVLIATNEGVSRFDGERFAILEVVEAPRNGEGWVLDADDVWLVANAADQGMYRYDGEKLYHLALSKSPEEDAFRIRYPNVGFSPSGVYSIYKDRSGHVWFGTASVGLCRFDGRSLSWMYEERLTTTPGGGAFGIRSIYQDRAGEFWICNTRQRFVMSPDVTLEGGHSLLKYEKKEGVPDAGADTDRNFNYIFSIVEDDAGALWMACGADGVWKFDGEIVTRYPVGDGAFAICIDLDRHGKLWLGTLEHGIHTFEGGSFEPFTPHEPSS